MIYFYTGVPGSGKSLHIAKTIYSALQKGQNVISNVDICISKIPPIGKHPLGHFVYVSYRELTENAIQVRDKYGRLSPPKDVYSYIYGLYNFSELYHKHDKKGKMIEHQTLIVLDECQELFNSRSWNRSDRLTWIKFFRVHRHLGYDCLLSSQDDKAIDKQIRPVLEKQVLHRNVANYKLLGKILSFPFKGNLFMCIESMYGYKKADAHTRSYFMVGNQKYFDIYDSYEII